MVLLSWMPFAQLAVWLTSATGSQADQLQAVIWGLQIVIGLVGVVLAGRDPDQRDAHRLLIVGDTVYFVGGQDELR